MMRSLGRGSLLFAAGVCFAVLQPISPIAHATAPVSAATDRQEQVIDQGDGVVVSQVSFLLPLPSNAPPHPPACDRTSFLRYRAADGPANSADADSVVVQQQGLDGGSMNSDTVARNTVRSAHDTGRKVEFWAMARRSTCLDESAGFDYALRTHNYLDAVDYYFNGKPIDGRVFPGFQNSQDLAVLDSMGLERVLRDQYEIMLHEIPDQVVRQHKYVCTGISLGGLVTGFFADWDFGGGDPDASGDSQCAAYVAQDSMVSSDPVALENTPFLKDLTNALISPVNNVLKAAQNGGVLPRVFGDTPVIGTKAMMLYRLAGLAAYLDPDGESQLLAHLPHDPAIDSTLNFLFSSTWADFVTNGADGSGTMRDYRFTNTALLGELIGNTSCNFELLQQGVGALDGGPVRPKSFPNPGDATQIPLIGNYLRLTAGPQDRVAPADRSVLYTWRNYNNVVGVPYTSPGHQVADIRDVARQLASGSPSAYWETYFPLRVVLDIAAGYGGARTGDMANLRYHGLSRLKPNLVLWAGDSIVQFGPGTVFPVPQSAIVQTLPGYNHIDTIGAAAVQNNGQPDYSGRYLAEFLHSLS